MTYRVTGACMIAGIPCIGCCGHHFISKAEVTQALTSNLEALHAAESLQEFRDQNQNNTIHACGICRNAIIKDDKPCCPLHPELNHGHDLRDEHCDKDHLCKSAFLYDLWDNEKKHAFAGFVKRKNLDWYELSIQMDSGALAASFIEWYGHTAQKRP